MKRTPFADWPCSIARAVDLIGDWWTPLVLREAYLGVRRFDDFQRNLGIGRNILTQRLHRLVDEEMLARRPYQERPVRHEYVLTDKGRDFYPVVAAMQRWGDRWLAGEAGPPIVLHHRLCDHDMEAQVVCSECGEPLALRDVRARRGPGFRPTGPRGEETPPTTR
ncbi:MAG TPA: helix-turn-helix domain-containing protein [Acidimicrobiales bacterium]|nr:helix-turn-helix domain-containing protein [Acidimicrobiales bacterium]